MVSLSKKKITLLSLYPIFPPNSGFKNRVYYLYKELAKWVDIEIISMTGSKEKPLKQEIAPNLWEIRIPKSQNQVSKEIELSKKYDLAREDIFDLVQMILLEESPEFVDAFRKSAMEADWVICSQPYFYPMVKKYYSGKLVYDSHNVEYLLKKQLLKNNEGSKKLLDLLHKVEKELCEKASIVSVVTATDEAVKTYEKLFNIEIIQGIPVPIGADLEESVFVSPNERVQNKKLSGYSQKTALFIGSGHKPNLDACDIIIDVARQVKDVTFLLMGHCCKAYDPKDLPENIVLLGVLSQQDKQKVLAFADMALNPIIRGEGVNVKMFDYIASGVPVITTALGTRGMNLPYGTVDICEAHEFADSVKKVNFEKVFKARAYIEQNFDWKVIAENFYSKLF